MDSCRASCGSSAVFNITRFEDAWIVTRNGRKIRLRLSLEAAVSDAMTAAIECFKQGVESEVFFSAGEQVATLWRNGALAMPLVEADQITVGSWAA